MPGGVGGRAAAIDDSGLGRPAVVSSHFPVWRAPSRHMKEVMGFHFGHEETKDKNNNRSEHPPVVLEGGSMENSTVLSQNLLRGSALVSILRVRSRRPRGLR